MKQLCEDLANEHRELESILADLSDEAWMAPTPSPGWDIKKQVCHLAYFDGRAALAVSDAAGFMEHIQEVLGDAGRFFTMLDEIGRDKSVEEVMNWWRGERQKMLQAYALLDPKERLFWYGPPMSSQSHATARLMETWAHGQDIFDALRIKRPGTDRLRHIAHLGVTTFGWSYQNRGLAVPETPVRVELNGPSGAVWAWGPEDAPDRITGPAVDFCLVVTQRRHADDTGLNIAGETAYDWMLKAQCFAGPPTDGPGPGERVIFE